MKIENEPKWEYTELDPWDHIGVRITAMLVWLFICIGLLVAACFVKNIGLSIILAIIGVSIASDNVDPRISRIVAAYKEHLVLKQKKKA